MKPFINDSYRLEKYPGKGGWTYAVLPEANHIKNTAFSWIKVKGSVDSYELKNYKLMRMANRKLFLPVKSDIRKKIGKQAGDWIQVTLFEDNQPTTIPEELMLCLQEESLALKIFNSYSDSQRKEFVDWIYAAKREETRVNRIAITINKLLRGERLRG